MLLTLRAPGSEEQTLRFEAESVLVGSDDMCDVTLTDEGVDSREAVLVAREKHVELFHIGVSGGVLVNGQLVTHADLAPADEVWIGGTAIQVRTGTEAPDKGVKFTEIASTVRAEEAAPDAAAARETARATGAAALAPQDLRFQLLDEVRQLINSIGTSEDIFESILDTLFSAVPVRRGFIGLIGDDGELHIRAHRNSEKGAGGNESIAVSRTLLNKVMESGKAVLTSDAEADPDLQMARSIHALRIRAATCVPLKVNRRVIGVAYGDNRERPGSLTKDHLSILNALASVAAVAVEKMRLLQESEAKQKYEHALRIARSIQRHLLPAESPSVKGLDVFGSSESCDETGGDYYDYFDRGDDRLSIVVADVTGHGVGSALLMATVRAALRALVEAQSSLDQLFFQLNNMISDDLKGGRFVTCLMATFEPGGRSMVHVGAGHTPLVHYRAATQETSLVSSLGPPLGIVKGAPFHCHERIDLEEGDVLLILTDGIIEAANPVGQLFGFERLEQVVKEAAAGGAEAVVGAVNGAVMVWTEGRPIHDDATMVAVKIQ
ncbi:MAG: SpoIIE family protein phosphatase [Planctomycetota bacterium]|jgi:serine phosphatase RsbU (regulator of sigma subunit)